ncbi:phospholipase C, phosphocholine-specific [Pendulispora brunnea]|uniref:phospholipase C n=1 Tax=Pendulispora brunnea TaxID=2905690 RepID=A0ABZ2K559_9BACT
MDRRHFLKLAAASAGSTAVLNLLPTHLRRALAMPVRTTGSLDTIEHVVIFMQENRSFDHYFGTLRGVRGFSDRSALQLQTGKSVFYQPNGSSTLLPYPVTEQYMSGTPHDWGTGHSAWNGGLNDKWVQYKGTSTMAYYARNDLAFYHALADAFTICDAYHCSVMGPTNPNRLYLWSGTVDPGGKGGGPVIDNDESRARTWTTYPERLQAAGISWKVYQERDNYDDNALAWFKQYREAKPGSPLYDRGMATVDNLVQAFRADVKANKLPKVSWLVAPTALSEHPAYGPVRGAALTSQLLDVLAAAPEVWAKTVFILTYDENDGFFDHVPAPVPPAGTPDEFVNGQPIGLGVRVPTIVVSPFSRGGFVCSETFDHTSILRFLEAWTGIKEPNISAWRRAVCGDLTRTLDLTSSTVTWPRLPVTTDPGPGPEVTVKPPRTQRMPVQEAGTRAARALPYQPNANLRADAAAGKVWIDMGNTGASVAQLAAYANRFRSDGPWRYDIGGTPVSDSFNARAYGGGKYDLSLYGPNRFLRRFAGDLNAPGKDVGVTSLVTTDEGGKLHLVFTNEGTSAVTVTVTANNYRTDGPWTYSVAPGGSASDSWRTGTYGDGWYDLTVTISSDPSFSQRLVGHIETGSPSVSG